MAMRVLYLDVDDEITSAAARIRSAEEIRVAIVLPHGSRVATSRINFRLLTRDATLNGKRLSIIAGDPATRALAASAGLPIFATVAEYETALDAEKGSGGDSSGSGGDAVPVVSDVPIVATAVGPVSTAEELAEAPPPPDVPRPRKPRSGPRRKPAEPAGDDLWTAASTTAPTVDAPAEVRPRDQAHPIAAGPGAAVTASAAETAAAAATAGEGAGPVGGVPAARSRTESIDDFVPARPSSPRTPAIVSAERVVADTPSRALIADRPFAPLTNRTPMVVGGAVLGLALLVGGVGAYLVLPSASVVITPRETSIGPIALQITASPSQTEPDQTAKVVPALSKPVDVEVTQTFQVTGKRVEETAADGLVRFDNFNPVSSNTILKGSIVRTQSGVGFRTNRTITIDAARFDPSTSKVTPSRATVTVTAVEPGVDGNVRSNAITRVPENENSTFLDVTNPDATSGGKRDTFPRVTQADLDKATAALRTQLTTEFAARLADPALAVDGTTVFPETAVLGEPSFSVDPATLLGDEIATFDLGASADGTVLAVDESAVEVVAAADIASHVEPGYSLVDGSSAVDPSPGVVESGVITFPVTVTAKEILTIDPEAIEAEIRGKSLTEAQTILARYGSAELSVWPDWVGTIPTLDARVDVRSAVASSEPAP
jgi:hypothetical protein